MTVKEVGPIFTLLLTLVIAINGYIVATVAYGTYTRGPFPVKHLQSDQSYSSDVLEALRNAGRAVDLQVRSGDVTLNNIYLSSITLTNTGGAPVLPSDFFGKIAIRTTPPWKLLTIGSSNGPRILSLDWSRLNDTEFQADPVLINPGDIISITVYMTRVDDKKGDQQEKVDKPPLQWDMRVANLQQIEILNFSESDYGTNFIPIVVEYYGYSILLILSLLALYVAVYTYLISLLGWLKVVVWRAVAANVGIGLISIMAADATNAYVYPTFMGSSNYLNLPILVVNIALISFLSWKVYRTSTP